MRPLFVPYLLSPLTSRLLRFFSVWLRCRGQIQFQMLKRAIQMYPSPEYRDIGRQRSSEKHGLFYYAGESAHAYCASLILTAGGVSRGLVGGSLYWKCRHEPCLFKSHGDCYFDGVDYIFLKFIEYGVVGCVSW